LDASEYSMFPFYDKLMTNIQGRWLNEIRKVFTR
jgi:hypothetical protein